MFECVWGEAFEVDRKVHNTMLIFWITGIRSEIAPSFDRNRKCSFAKCGVRAVHSDGGL